MKNLIFVSKDIGLRCLKFHLQKFPRDKNYIVVCNPNKDLIACYLRSKSIDFQFLEDFSIENLKHQNFDWLLNLWGGYIFKKDILSIIKNSLNIHPSYLPYGRGRDPVVWAIRNSHPAGVTLHEINEKIDAGDIWCQEPISYKLPLRGKDLYSQVTHECVRIFKRHWPGIRSLEYIKLPQSNLELSSKKRDDLIHDRLIKYNDLNTAQKDLLSKIMAHDFGRSYSAEIEINEEKYKIRLQLEKVNES